MLDLKFVLLPLDSEIGAATMPQGMIKERRKRSTIPRIDGTWFPEVLEKRTGGPTCRCFGAALGLPLSTDKTTCLKQLINQNCNQ